MTTVPADGRFLRVLPESFVVERATALPTGSWLALVNAPEGLTVIRPAEPADADPWAALYSGDAAHGLDVPGVLAALLTRLAAADVPVFVASTFNGDLVLVPRSRLDAARAALLTAGYAVAG